MIKRPLRKRCSGSWAFALGVLVCLLVGSPALFAASPNSQPGQQPAASISIFRVRRGLLVLERSAGILTYRGKEFPIKVRGLSPVHYQQAVTLPLYNFDSVKDLEGTFKPADNQSCCVLRNELGIEIRFTDEHDGGNIRFDANGVTIAIASEAIETRPSLIHGRSPALLPQSAGLGSRNIGPVLVTPTLNLQTAGFAEGNNGWGGKFNEPLRDSHYFFEQSNEEGLNASLNLGHYGIIVGRVSGIFSMTGGGLDAGATNAGDLHPWDYGLESGYLEWASGPLFPDLGYDAVTISGGPQNFSIADGFLFTRGATNGGNRGASWLNPRTAFAETGVISLQTRDVLLQGFYLEPNDNPSTHTRLAGVNLEVPVGEYATTGFTYCNIFHSDSKRENGMNLLYWRGKATPIPRLPNLRLISAFAAESNGAQVSGATGWYVSSYYRFPEYIWKPTLYYRYASFSGGGSAGNHNFDPLFYGSSDWGSWYQGEILGNWVTSNSNLITHQVRLEFSPSNSTLVDLLFYKFMLYSRAQDLAKPVMPVTSKNLAEEIDLAVEYAPTPWWLITMTLSAAIPNQAATQITGGTETWVQSMLTTSITF